MSDIGTFMQTVGAASLMVSLGAGSAMAGKGVANSTIVAYY